LVARVVIYRCGHLFWVLEFCHLEFNLVDLHGVALLLGIGVRLIQILAGLFIEIATKIHSICF
jgi:hypothetical protein